MTRKDQAPEGAQRSEEQGDETLSRRHVLGGLGILSLLSAACSASEFGGISKALGKKRGDSVDGGDGGDGEDGEDGGESCKLVANENGEEVEVCDGEDGGLEDGGDGGHQESPSGILGDGSDETCHANNTTKIDIDHPDAIDIDHPDAPTDLKPRVVFYGRNDSATATALVAFKFEGTTQDIHHVILTKADGTLLALEGITQASKNSEGKYRPIIVDNLFLHGQTQVVFLISVNNKLYRHDETIAFKDANMKHLSPQGLMNGYSARDAVVAQFETAVDRKASKDFAKDSGFNVDTNVAYPNDFNAQDVRNLYTVTKNSKWKVGDRMSGFTFTDIMGDPIDLNGGGLVEHQVFIATRNGQRTILMIG